MSESHQHMLLVEALSKSIETDKIWRNSPFVYCDLVDSTGTSNVPQIIDSYRPDVFASSVIDSFYIIGEAKTKDDIDNDHTISQLKSFISYIQSRGKGQIWLAVPWLCAGTMARICRQARSAVQGQSIPFRVTEYMIGQGQAFGRTWYG